MLRSRFASLLAVTLASFVSLAPAAHADPCDTLDGLLKDKLKLADQVQIQKAIVQKTEDAINDQKDVRSGRWFETIAGVAVIAITYGVTYDQAEVENGFEAITDALKSSPSFYAFAGAGIAATADGTIHIRLANRSIKQLQTQLPSQEASLAQLESKYREKIQDLELAAKNLGCPMTVSSSRPVDLGDEIEIKIQSKSE
jgi:hypothetical protein